MIPELPIVLSPVAGVAVAWVVHAVRLWLRHRHGAP